jgi:integrase
LIWIEDSSDLLLKERRRAQEGLSISILGLKKCSRACPRGLHTKRIFLRDGEPFDEVKRSFKTARKKAGIEDFCFHDLRHCAINNLRLAGNDYFKIMAMSGHKTMSVFKRYNLVTEAELSEMKWHDGAKKDGSMDTYMDTMQK